MNSSFLYPFLEDANPQISSGDLADELVAAALANWDAGDSIDAKALVANDARIGETASLLASAVRRGKRVFAVGNGGSACDAERFVRLMGPLVAARTLLDSVVVTALANDVGAARIFERQIETFVGDGDVLVAFTTSGRSGNITA